MPELNTQQTTKTRVNTAVAVVAAIALIGGGVAFALYLSSPDNVGGGGTVTKPVAMKIFDVTDVRLTPGVGLPPNLASSVALYGSGASTLFGTVTPASVFTDGETAPNAVPLYVQITGGHNDFKLTLSANDTRTYTVCVGASLNQSSHMMYVDTHGTTYRDANLTQQASTVCDLSQQP